MIPLLTRAEARALDADAVERLGVPSLVLMENAGRGAADALVTRFPEALARVVVVGGTGQNGGDGWVVARHLWLRGHRPRAFVVGDETRVRGDAAVNLAVLRHLGVEVHALDPDRLELLVEALGTASLVVDALFGTGLDRPLGGGYAEAVRLLDLARAPCVSLDLPSGVDADTGAILGVAPTAALTVTFAGRKRGLLQHPGRTHAGEVVCADIGVPPPPVGDFALLELSDVRGRVPARSGAAHKGSEGHVLVVAGSPGHTGAAVLAGRGALRMGAGLVTLAVREEAQGALDAKVLELMTASFAAGEGLEGVLRLLEGKASAVVGPGLGLDAAARALALGLARRCPVPCVLDADALTALADGHVDGLRDAAAARVLTPHPGEAARLLGVPTAEVQADRYRAARALAERAGQVVVLKGAGTVIAAPDGRGFVCDRGTPAMATAGTGDVLTGALGALLARLGPLDAAVVGVFLHAVAGELAAPADRGLLAGELADALPRALSHCRAAVR